MKKVLLFVIALVLACTCFVGCGDKSDMSEIVGIWRLEYRADTEYARYIYFYDEGYCKYLYHNYLNPYHPEYEWMMTYDWEYDGETLIYKDCNTGEIQSKYTVKDGKLYARDHSLIATKVSDDVSNEKPSF